MATIGYCRVGTSHQSLEAQRGALAARCERIFSDRISGARDDRPGLARLPDYVRPGGTVVVTALDRLGRSLPGVIRTVETPDAGRGAAAFLHGGVDCSTSTERMLAGTFASLAEYERDLMHERAAAAR